MCGVADHVAHSGAVVDDVGLVCDDSDDGFLSGDVGRIEIFGMGLVDHWC